VEPHVTASSLIGIHAFGPHRRTRMPLAGEHAFTHKRPAQTQTWVLLHSSRTRTKLPY